MIVIVNGALGVGKTSTAVNLAYLSATRGARTLVWDLGPQGAATFCFRIKAKVKGGGKKLIRGKRSLRGRIRGTDFEGLDLLPADFSNRHLDLILRAGNMRHLLEPRRAHDVVGNEGVISQLFLNAILGLLLRLAANDRFAVEGIEVSRQLFDHDLQRLLQCPHHRRELPFKKE